MVINMGVEQLRALSHRWSIPPKPYLNVYCLTISETQVNGVTGQSQDSAQISLRLRGHGISGVLRKGLMVSGPGSSILL